MTISEEYLKNRIITALKEQGFLINPHLRIENYEKETIKKVHMQKRIEQINFHKTFLLDTVELIKEFGISGNEIKPNEIELKLIEVRPKSFELKLFLWWNLVWWNLPYESRLIGRQMKFILWDTTHNAPFGLIGLQSPPLKSSVRDNSIGIEKEDRDFWINQSLYAQRVGALPPYNELLGGKMVALSLTSNEIREIYKKKYENKKTFLKKREIPSRLLFVTTTSAYGKSSVYERLKYNNEPVSIFLGYTTGKGTFHIPEHLYIEMLKFLQQKEINIKRGFGTGPSRKLRLIDKCLRLLNIPSFSTHTIKRGYYLFPNVKNLSEVIQKREEPVWYNRPFHKLSEYWMNRWCIPRSKRNIRWRGFNCKEFFAKIENELNKLGTPNFPDSFIY